MGKKKSNRRDVHGWVVIDKPQGMGSTDVVNKVRWLFNAQKAGHSGTLDPMATGVLPVALGEATKTMPFALNADKAYEFEVHWGVETDSLDADGVETRRCESVPTEAEIRAILPAFLGEISQVPPKVSALKVGGKRAHDLVRAGEDFELAARQTRVHALDLIEHKGARTRLYVAAMKGFYVRALARDLAHRLGTLGHLTALRRVRSGSFAIEHCIGLDILSTTAHIEARDAFLRPITLVLDDIPALELDHSAARQLRNGQSVAVFRRSLLERLMEQANGALDSGQNVVVHSSGKPVGIATFEGGWLKPARLFNL